MVTGRSMVSCAAPGCVQLNARERTQPQSAIDERNIMMVVTMRVVRIYRVAASSVRSLSPQGRDAMGAATRVWHHRCCKTTDGAPHEAERFEPIPRRLRSEEHTSELQSR